MNLRERVWIGLSLLSAAGILLHLGGSAWSWSPPLWQLVVFLIILLVIGWGGREADDGHGARRWQKWLSALRENPFGAALLLLAAVGTAVRMLSLDSGLGQTPINIDETRLAESVLEFFRTGEVPHETVEHYPGILYWLLVGSSLFAYLGTLLTGTARGLGDIPLETFVLAGRMTSTLLAAGITIFTGLIGRALRGSATGLLAAAVVALVPLSVNISSLLRNDAAQLLFITAAVWATIELAHTRDRWWALGAGGLAGAATAVKYSSVFVLLAVLLAAAVPARTRVSRASLALLGFVAVLATTNHFLWTDFPNFVRQLAVEMSTTGAGHWSTTDNPAHFYLSVLSGSGPGAPLLALAAGFVAYACTAGRLVHWVVLAFPLTYMWFMTQQPAQFPRWVYPLVPFVAVAGSFGLAGILGWLRSSTAGQSRARWVAVQVAVVVLAVTVVWPPTRMVATEISGRSAPATYDLVHAWLRQHAAPDDRVLAEDHWLDLADLDLQVHRVSNLAENLAGTEYSLWAHDWIVVPEGDFGHPGLQHLQLAQTFLADYEFGGNRGFDFMIYAAPYRVLGPIEVHFGTAEATGFLGPEWNRGDSPRPGLSIPPDGASVFVPALEHSDIAVHITFMSQGVGTHTPPLRIELDGEHVPLVEEPSSTADVRMASGTISHVPTGVMEIRIVAAGDDAVRIIRLTVSETAPQL